MPAEIEKLRQHGAAEWKPFRSTLDLDKLIAIGHDDVEIDVGCRVFWIVEVQHGRSFDHTDAYCGYMRTDRALAQGPRCNQLVDRQAHRNKCTGNRRGAGT